MGVRNVADAARRVRRVPRHRLDRLRVRRHQADAVRRVGPDEPAVRLRPLEARRRARGRPESRRRAHVVGRRPLRRQHGEDDPAARGRAREALVRLRPARPPDRRRRPRPHARAVRAGAPGRHLARHEPGRGLLARVRAGRARRRRRRPEPRRPDHHRRAATAPSRAAPRELGAREPRAARTPAIDLLPDFRESLEALVAQIRAAD